MVSEVTDRAITCPKCGKAWRPWKGTKLTCHAACYFTAEEAEAILRRAESGPVGLQRLADDHGVAMGVIKSAFHVARRNRRRSA